MSLKNNYSTVRACTMVHSLVYSELRITFQFNLSHFVSPHNKLLRLPAHSFSYAAHSAYAM